MTATVWHVLDIEGKWWNCSWNSCWI